MKTTEKNLAKSLFTQIAEVFNVDFIFSTPSNAEQSETTDDNAADTTEREVDEEMSDFPLWMFTTPFAFGIA